MPFAPHGQRLLRHGFGIADWDAGGWTAAGSKSVGIIYFKYAPSHGHPAVVKKKLIVKGYQSAYLGKNANISYYLY